MPLWVACSFAADMDSCTVARKESEVSESRRCCSQSSTESGSTVGDVHSDVETEPETIRTSMILKNLPTACTRTDLVELLDHQGFNGTYDFVYIPSAFDEPGAQPNFGYAFINFINTAVGEQFKTAIDGFDGWTMSNNGAAEVDWSRGMQGLDAHVERYINSPVMHFAVDDMHKPAMFKNGQRVPFPEPTMPPKAPRRRRRQNKDVGKR